MIISMFLKIAFNRREKRSALKNGPLDQFQPNLSLLGPSQVISSDNNN